jgi:hypothetical protein
MAPSLPETSLAGNTLTGRVTVTPQGRENGG